MHSDLLMLSNREVHLGSPVREICTPGSAWGDECKTPCLLGEIPARKRTWCEAPHGLPLVEARLYHQPWNVANKLNQPEQVTKALSVA
jgi:hypothetical protein